MLIGVFQGLKHWLSSKGMNGRQERIVGDRLGGRRVIPEGLAAVARLASPVRVGADFTQAWAPGLMNNRLLRGVLVNPMVNFRKGG
jgi:hypothetical protein